MDGTREEVIEKFRVWFHADEQAELRERVKKELTGRVLGCWCKGSVSKVTNVAEPNTPCHGDVYVEFCDRDRRRLKYGVKWGW